MPTYDYRCNECGHKWDEFQSITAKPLRKCPACGRLKAERIISAGGGIIFKGSGFYKTDYRSESWKKGAEAAKGSESSGKSSDSSGTSSAKDSGSSGKSDKGSKES